MDTEIHGYKDTAAQAGIQRHSSTVLLGKAVRRVLRAHERRVLKTYTRRVLLKHIRGTSLKTHKSGSLKMNETKSLKCMRGGSSKCMKGRSLQLTHLTASSSPIPISFQHTLEETKCRTKASPHRPQPGPDLPPALPATSPPFFV